MVGVTLLETRTRSYIFFQTKLAESARESSAAYPNSVTSLSNKPSGVENAHHGTLIASGIAGHIHNSVVVTTFPQLQTPRSRFTKLRTHLLLHFIPRPTRRRSTTKCLHNSLNPFNFISTDLPTSSSCNHSRVLRIQTLALKGTSRL